MRSLPHVHGIFCLTVSDRPKRDRGCPFYIWTLTLTVGARSPNLREIPEFEKYRRNSKNRFFEFRQVRPSGRVTWASKQVQRRKGADTR